MMTILWLGFFLVLIVPTHEGMARLSWLGLDDWLPREMGTGPKTVAYPDTNQAQHKAGMLIRHNLFVNA